MPAHVMHRIEVTEEEAVAADRDTIGGAPHLPAGQDHPRCKLCDQPMVLFWQFDVRQEFGLPFAPGSHLLAFMCPEHNDASIISNLFDAAPLPPRFWEQEAGHYAVLLVPPGSPTTAGPIDRYLDPRKLRFLPAPEQVTSGHDFSFGSPEFKVGGVPGWINYAPQPKCSCGGAMRFVCQLPDSFAFPQSGSAPAQPDSFSKSDYCFLLGNAVYILACEKQCDARSVLAICDN